MGRVRAPLAVALLWTATATLVIAHLLGPTTGQFADATYLAAILAGPVVAWLGTWRSPGRKLIPVLISSGLTAAALGDVIWFAYSWAGLEPDVSLADVPYYAGYLGLGAAMLVIVLKKRQDVRRVDVDAAIDALTVVAVSVLVLWSVAVHGIVDRHVDVGDDPRRPRGLPRVPTPCSWPSCCGSCRCAATGRPWASGSRPAWPAGSSPTSATSCSWSRTGLGPPRRGLDGRRHPGRHVHLASSGP